MLGAPMAGSETLAELFTAPLDAFVATRDRLAAELARQGRKDESRELKKLRRPSPSAWATNQVVRRARPAVDAFLEASDALRARQDALLAGRGDQTAYQAGVEELRQATAALAGAAREALAAAGRPDDRHVVDAVVANVRAAALEGGRRPELFEGRLQADLQASDDGLGGLLGASVAAAGAAPPRPAPAPAAKQVPDLERARAEARAKELAEARRDEAQARAHAERAEAAAREASARRDEAKARVLAAEDALSTARDALREAEASQRQAADEQARADGAARAATRRRESLENR
jgi:hypothetical protein